MRDVIDTPDKFGAILTRLLITEPDFSAHLCDAVVPALETELLLDVAERVQRSGGETSLMVLRIDDDGEGHERARAIIGKMSIRSSAVDGDHHVPFDRRCTLGHLLSVIGEGASITLRISDDELAFEDFDEAPEVRLSDGTPALVR